MTKSLAPTFANQIFRRLNYHNLLPGSQVIAPEYRANVTQDEMEQITSRFLARYCAGEEMRRLIVDMLSGARFDARRAQQAIDEWDGAK